MTKTTFGVYFSLIIVSNVGCTNNNRQHKTKKEFEKSTQDLSLHIHHSFNKNDFDEYSYVNDTISQSAFIRYLSPSRIVFNILTTNKRTGEWCELMDTAINEDLTGNDATAEDETTNGETYGVKEFTYDRDSIHTWIGIEPQHGKRLTFYSGLDTICLRAVGTLRLISIPAVRKKTSELKK